MPAVRYTRRAEVDLRAIGAYTAEKWGKDQAARYLNDLEVCCQSLSDHPALGRACDEIRPGLRRLEHGPHVIFYRQQRAGVTVVRVLHQRMLAEKYFSEKRRPL